VQLLVRERRPSRTVLPASTAAADPIGAALAFVPELAVSQLATPPWTESGERRRYDDTPIASYVDPPLTTVRQDFVTEAIVGLAQLLDEIEGDSTEDRPRARPLPVQLTVRQSTQPLPAAALATDTRPMRRPPRAPS
jgi:hypothetical protein